MRNEYENKKCFVCGQDIKVDQGDMFIKTANDNYLCGEHYHRLNELKINSEVVEKILEENFGGIVVIYGEAEFKIYY